MVVHTPVTPAGRGGIVRLMDEARAADPTRTDATVAVAGEAYLDASPSGRRQRSRVRDISGKELVEAGTGIEPVFTDLQSAA